jgi:pimeloyl-ACP methyl ester carboxylesterase
MIDVPLNMRHPRSATSATSQSTAQDNSRTSAVTTDRQNHAPERIGTYAWQASFHIAAAVSPYATHACVDTWLTDFRADLPKIDIPTLVVHGTADRILP